MLGPIFMRELVTVPRRAGHYAGRAALIGLLTILGITTWQATIGFSRDATLGEAAAFGLFLFQIVAFVQLLLTLFFATLSAAGAVSQEKDRRTFVLLLLTDMRDYEIVLGKMLGALLPITIQLLVTAPVLAMLLLLGGIDPEQVLQAVLVLGASAIAAGSLGGLIALWRERTFQALALSVLFLVLYICITQGLGVVGPMFVARRRLVPRAGMARSVRHDADRARPTGRRLGRTCAGLRFRARHARLVRALERYRDLEAAEVEPERRADHAARRTAGRRRRPTSRLELEKRAKAHAAPGKLRQVWQNPVLWREVRTLAYGRRPLLVKIAFGVVLALILYFAVSELNRPGGRPAFAAAYGLVPIAVLSLLLVSAQAATSITSERDGGALDVLLVTDISPREFVFGKILGVIYNCKEYMIPPLLLAIFYGVRGTLSRTPARRRNRPRCWRRTSGHWSPSSARSSCCSRS